MGSILERNKEMNGLINKAVLVDIDGTLVGVTEFDYDRFKIMNVSEREEYIDRWNKETMNSDVLSGGVEVLKEYKDRGYRLVFLTARGVSCKSYTIKKLREIGVLDMVDSMWHRPYKWEGVSSAIYKENMIKMLLGKGWVFEYAIDDENENLVMMERMGMKVVDAKVWW